MQSVSGKYVNSRLKVRQAINAIQCEDNSIADSNQEKGGLFNKFFTSVFTKEDCTTIPHDGNASHLSDIDIIHLPLYLINCNISIQLKFVA